MIRKLFYKLFVGGDWKIAYRKIGDRGYFKIIDDVPEECAVADPFLFECNDVHYIFAEEYSTKSGHGRICLYQIVDDKPVYRGVLIENAYHMSYPCAFSYNEYQYMIPETKQNNTIELYRAVHFPEKWELDTVLLSGRPFVDSTVFVFGDKYYLLSYAKEKGGYRLVLFSLDMEKKTLHEITRTSYEKNIGRPAGAIYEDNGLKRPAQKCDVKYGEGLLVYNVKKLDDSGFEERKAKYIAIKDVPINGKFQRIHTYNRDSQYEVIDIFREKYSLFRGLKLLITKYKARKRKKANSF